MNSVGDIKASLQTTNHGNWFLCNGQAVSRTDYADLFELIGTNFGAGDGVATFNIPDYRGKFLRGLGGNSAEDVYTTQEEGLPNITGSVGRIGNAEPYPVGCLDSFSRGNMPWAGGGSYDTRSIRIDASKSSPIYGNSTHVTPINQAVNYFIKVK